MQWLIAHMWMALAATGILGLLFGWAVRGLRLRGMLRKAEGERNIALGTLSEKEAELEALYAAGRAPVEGDITPAATASNDQELRVELADREEKLQALSDELARTKAELNEVRSNAEDSGRGDLTATAVGAAVAGMAAGAAMPKGEERLDANLDKEEATLEWRNRYLESRVRSLEDKIKEMAEGETSTTAVSDAPEVDTIGDVTESGLPSLDSDVGLEKLRWQNDYLKQRLNYFEQHGSVASGGAAALVGAATTKLPESSDEPSDPSDATGDEEIASLRWRNRYLEGRLAYYEGDKTISDEGGDGVAVQSKTEASLPAVAAPQLGDIEAPPSAEPSVEEEDAGLEATDLSERAPDGSEADTSNGMSDGASSQDLAVTARGVKPIALDGPVNGEGDDLTAIGGIGPKIQEVLNGFGIYHYDQIASWTPENVEWVDDHLAFEGRIEREQWVQQAEALSNVD